MPYSQFTTIGKVKEAFGINTIEGDRFLKEIEPITPSTMLIEFLRESVPLASATGSEKALSEGIIYPILLEVRRILGNKVSLFSGEDFTKERQKYEGRRQKVNFQKSYIRVFKAHQNNKNVFRDA